MIGSIFDVRIRPAAAHETHALRQAVLRPHQPVSAMAYDGDALPDAGHFVAEQGEDVIGIASISPEAGDFDASAWRLRGMAVVPEAGGRGIGGLLLNVAMDHAEGHGGSLVWCNARTPAERFYERHGFTRHGEIFEIEGIGPHVVMSRPCPGRSTSS